MRKVIRVVAAYLLLTLSIVIAAPAHAQARDITLPVINLLVVENIGVSETPGGSQPARTSAVSNPATVTAPGTAKAAVTDGNTYEFSRENPTITVNETITASDSPNSLPEISLTVSESIGVVDSPQAFPPISLTVTENISVSDSPQLLPPISLTVTENIAVSDSPQLLPAMFLTVNENITVSDSSNFTRLPATVTGITPNWAYNNAIANISNLVGTRFATGATVKLVKAGSPDIIAVNVAVVSPTQITCQFNFTGTEWGYYDVVVTNTDEQSGTLPQGFLVRTQPATINGITPAYGVANTTANVELTGSGFISGSAIKLQKTGQPDIVAALITFAPTRITCTFGLVGAAIGSWDVTVVNPDNQTASLAGAFTVTMPTVEITIGQGTQSIEYLLGTNFHDRRVQVIYLASEIGRSGAISALALNVATPPGAPLNNWTIRMRHFTQSTESGIWIVAGAWDTVYQGNEPPGTSGWRVFNFSQPFEYNGSQNLEIDFSFNNSAVGGASGTCFYSTPGGNRTLFGASNSANGDPLTWSSTIPSPVLSNIVPNIRLTMGSTGGYSLTTTVSPAGSGTVNYSGGTFQAGTQLNLVAQANMGWVFDHWGGNATGTNPNIILTMDANKTVTAFFRAVQHTLTISKTVGGSVTAPGEGTFTYNYGQQVPLVAVPDTGYRFVNWTGDVATIVNYTAASTTITIGGNYSIVANFARITYQLTINTQGSGTTTPPVGVHTYNQGTQVELTATPTTGYQFVTWSGDVTVNTNPITVTMTGNKNITANFSQITYTLTVNVVGSGTVAKNPNQTSYASGTSVQLTATPAVGWTFLSWSGDVIGTTNPAGLTINGNKMVTVTFVTHTPTINIIKQNPTLYEGRQVQVSGSYRGWESGHGSPPITRSDWVIQDATGSLYVTGNSMGLSYPADIGKPVVITGIIRLKNGQTYIEILPPVRR